MEEKERAYIAIDLKSFYASVECVDRGLNPLTTNLVVADLSRTEKTICLAVTPSLKQHGISGRARLFEVVERVREVNEERRRRLPSGCFTGSSSDDTELKARPDLKLNYLVAPPRMARYVEVSRQIYNIYLRHVAPEDIYPYSVDEVFMDVTDYLHYNRLTPHEMAMKMIREVLRETGITATAGIGTNLYLAKVAMDVMAKKTQPDADGVRIAELDEMSYRRLLWDHRPLTAFWRVGRGIAQKLQAHGLDTMGKVARCSVHNEDLLYRLFGVNAELLIDHAWGWEPCTIAQVKAYRPETNSFSSGQVLSCAYDARKARVVVQEMADGMALSLLGRRMVTSQVVLTVNYDRENLERPEIRERYTGEVTNDMPVLSIQTQIGDQRLVRTPRAEACSRHRDAGAPQLLAERHHRGRDDALRPHRESRPARPSPQPHGGSCGGGGPGGAAGKSPAAARPLHRLRGGAPSARA